MTFNSDHSYIERERDMESDETDEYTGKWRIENNTLTLLYGDESREEWVIEKLTKDELILCYEIEEEDGYWFERLYLKR